MVRDFRKQTGMPVERWLALLEQLESALETRDLEAVAQIGIPLSELAGYYERLQDLAASYEKNPEKREENVRIIQVWQRAVERLQALLEGGRM